jgi:phage antirepressor YoqD-like protein
MSNLMIAVKTMSSLEIAALTGKNHADVLRDIRKMLIDLGLGESSFAGSYFSEQNKAMPLFNLDREHTDCLLTGYSAKARMLVIKRWHELEAQQTPQIPRTMAEALRLAADQAEQIEQQQAMLLIAAPKAEALDRLSKADGETNITTAAKELGLQPKRLTEFLSAEKWIYKRAGGKSWLAYQDKIQQGLLVHKTVVIIKPDGGERVCDQVLVTAKGLAKLAQLTTK